MPQGISLNSGLEFPQQFERVFNYFKSVEVVIDKVLKHLVQMGDLDIELNPIAIKFVVISIKQVMSLLLKIFDDIFEFRGKAFHAF